MLGAVRVKRVETPVLLRMNDLSCLPLTGLAPLGVLDSSGGGNKAPRSFASVGSARWSLEKNAALAGAECVREKDRSPNAAALFDGEATEFARGERGDNVVFGPRLDGEALGD